MPVHKIAAAEVLAGDTLLTTDPRHRKGRRVVAVETPRPGYRFLRFGPRTGVTLHADDRVRVERVEA